jgi:hypothetical protein
MNKFLFIVAIALLTSFGLNAQTSAAATPELIYFEFASIDFDQYSKLHDAVKSNGSYSIETVCIPAKVICIKGLTATANSEGFQQLALKSGLIANPWLDQNQPRAFEDRCLSARTRN